MAEFMATDFNVYRKPEGDLPELVAQCNQNIDGAAEQIARSLNRLPDAEALLLNAAAALRFGDTVSINAMAELIEEFMVNG